MEKSTQTVEPRKYISVSASHLKDDQLLILLKEDANTMTTFTFALIQSWR
jgi:hypothetical protein